MQTSNHKHPWDIPIGEATANLIFDMLSPLLVCEWEDVSMFDFGAGNGRYSRMFSNKIPAERITSVDIDGERMAVLARDGFNAMQIHGGNNDLTFIPDNSLHLVFSSNVLEHIRHDMYLHYLKEIHRILVPRGVFFIGMPNYPWKRMYDMHQAWRKKGTDATISLTTPLTLINCPSMKLLLT